MARQRVQLHQISDFTGGVNYREDAAGLAPNELEECVNMRILPSGGVEKRKSCYRINSTDLTTTAKNIWSFYGNGVKQIVVQQGNDAAYSTGGNFTAINPDATTLTGVMRAASMSRVGTANSERLYVLRNAEQGAWKWDGAAATVLADASAAYNNNLAAPAGGRMPVAKYICSHAGFMFHAYHYEGLVIKTNRVRWSHPGEPEDYRTNDYIDVGADDGDVITGLASSGGTLFIFKARSVWMLTGYDSATWQLQRIVDGVGAVEQEAITVGPEGVYFFDGTKGVHHIAHHRATTQTSANIAWLWEKLAPRITDNTIPYQYVSGVTMAWMDNRLWVAVPWDGSTTNTRVFVFDPTIGKRGAWYAYQYADQIATGVITDDGIALGPMLEWRPTATQTLLLATTPTVAFVQQLDVDETGIDTFDGTGPGSTAYFSTLLSTAWFSGGTPGLKKRWRRPTFVFDADHNATIGLGVYTNFLTTAAHRSEQLTVTASSSGGGTWGSGNWGTVLWGPGPQGDQVLVRGSSFGNAYAIQLRLIGQQGQHWGLNAIDLRYIPQKVR